MKNSKIAFTWRKLATLFLVACILPAALATAAVPFTLELNTTLPSPCLDEQEYEEAIAACIHAIAQEPKNAGLYSQLALVHLQGGRFEEAIAPCTKAIELAPEFSTGYSSRAAVYFVNHEYDDAMTDCNAAIELDSEADAAYYFRAMIYFLRGEYVLARNDLNEVIKLTPEFANGYHLRGQTYFFLGEHDLALEDFNTTITRDSKHANAYNHRAFIRFLAKRYKETIADATLAIKYSNGDDKIRAMAYNNRGLAFLYQYEFKSSLDDFDEALKLDPTISIAYGNRRIASIAVLILHVILPGVIVVVAGTAACKIFGVTLATIPAVWRFLWRKAKSIARAAWRTAKSATRAIIARTWRGITALRRRRTQPAQEQEPPDNP